MRLAWFELVLAAFAMFCAGFIGWSIQQDDPTVWAAIGTSLLAGRLVLR